MKDIDSLKSIILAHRGIHDNKIIYENTLEAFAKSVKRNIAIELDVHILKDNELVVFHDNNLKRLTGIDKNIKHLTFPELKKIKIANKYKIPLLSEVLNLVHGSVLLNIEIKDDGRFFDLCEKLARLLDQYKGEFIIQSFFPKYIHWFKINRQNFTNGLLISSKIPGIYGFIMKRLLFLPFFKPDFLVIEKNFVINKRIQNSRKKALLLIWTIQSKEELQKYKRYADGFIMNIKN